MSDKKLDSKTRFLIVYASETGQAKAISEEIAERASEYGLKPDLFCISLTDKRFCIEKETCVVFVASTTDDGDPPRTALKFYRRLNRNTLKSDYLKNLNYTLLALGDSNYLKFAAFGRQLEHRLKALSAKSFYPTGYGDDAFGIETGVDPWIDNLWPALQKQLGLDILEKKSLSLLNSIDKRNLGSMNNSKEKQLLNGNLKDLRTILKEEDFVNCQMPKIPSPVYAISYKSDESKITFTPIKSTLVLAGSPLVRAYLNSAKQLSSGEDVKDTLELAFKFEDKTVDYEPGDSFGFVCSNNPEEVDILLNRLDLSEVADVPACLNIHEESTTKKKLPVHIPLLFSLRKLFLHHIEIRAVPKKVLLRILAEYTEIEEEKQCLCFLSSQEGSNYFTDYIRKPSLTVLDILLQFRSCKPPVEKLIEYLPPLKPRFYSVASSPLVDKSQIKIVFNIIKIKAEDGRQRDCEGVCTGWFHSLSSDVLSDSVSSISSAISNLSLQNESKAVFIYRRMNNNFRFPSDLKTPLIMVGPGTGIAPFMGYLQHREKLLENVPSEESIIGETWLFYGCRYKDRSFLYKKELDQLVQKKVLQHLVVSFSRDASTSEKVPKYVHENIKLHAQNVANCIKAGGKIMVCGDAKNMVHDVQQAFIEVLQIGSDMSEAKAKEVIQSLQNEQRYVNDVWA